MNYIILIVLASLGEGSMLTGDTAETLASPPPIITHDDVLVNRGDVEDLTRQVVALQYEIDGRPSGGGSAIVISVGRDGSALCATNYHVLFPGKGEWVDEHFDLIREGRNGNIQRKRMDMFAMDMEFHRRTFKIIDHDEDADIALIRVKPGLDLKPVEFGDPGEYRVGSRAWVVGNSSSAGTAVHRGVISRFKRREGLISTDAPVNPGNSGGPLFGNDLKLLGMMVYKHGGAEGIGYAIPSDILLRWVQHLQSDLHIPKASFGMRLGSLPWRLRQASAKLYPVFVDEVQRGSAAERAGLLVGDRVISANGIRVSGTDIIRGLRKRWTNGWAVTWRVLRGDEEFEFEVLPQADLDNEGSSYLGTAGGW